MANGNTVQIEKVETLEMTTTVDGLKRTVSVSNDAYIPDLTTNLLSVSQMKQKNVEVYFKNDRNGNNIAEVVYF